MTQKQILSQYAKQQGMLNTEYYIDDGYSGTNYDRPDFKRLEHDIEAGKIGTVITKDLSRLGRDYLKTGYYVEVLFPEYDVRYIAVNDSVDTSTGDNEFNLVAQPDLYIIHKNDGFIQVILSILNDAPNVPDFIASLAIISLYAW